MYLDYDKFIEMLVESGYRKIHSDLVTETWRKYNSVIRISQDDYRYVFDIETFEEDEVE